MKQRKDGRWLKVIKANGKSVYFYSTATTEKAAERDIARQMIEYHERQARGELFKQIADAWEKEHWPSLQNNTLRQYKPAKAQVVEAFGNTPIKEIDSADISAFLSLLKKRGYAKKTVQARKLICNLIFTYAVENRAIKTNPCRDVKLPKNLPQTKRKPATDADISKIKLSGSSEAAILANFYLYTGCRKGEALALTPSDINVEEKTVHISKTVEWLGQAPQIKNSPKTYAGDRFIPLPDFIFELIKDRMKNKYIFANRCGELYHDSQFTRMWNKFQKEIGIDVTPHQLRHSYATMLFDANIDVKTAQRWLGHADIHTTLDIYTHLSEQRQEDSKEKILKYMTAQNAD